MTTELTKARAEFRDLMDRVSERSKVASWLQDFFATAKTAGETPATALRNAAYQRTKREG